MDDPHAAWHRTSLGQLAEFQVWSELLVASGHRLHVFLPLHDRGVDGVLHLRGTDTLIPVQVKSRTHPDERIFRVHVQEAEAADPAVLIVAVLIPGGRPPITEPVVAVDAATLRELAHLVTVAGRRSYQIAVPWPPGGHSRWNPYCLSIAQLVATLLGDVAPVEGGQRAEQSDVPERGPATAEHGAMVGEMEVLRRLADEPDAGVFRGFPDDEFAEYIVRDCVRGGMIGVQVKCVATDADGTPREQVHFSASEAPWPTRSALVVIGTDGHRAVLERCVVMRGVDTAGTLRRAGTKRAALPVTFDVGSPWVVPLAGLGARLLELAREDAEGRWTATRG